MRTRNNNWFNTKTRKILFGIDVFHGGEWKGYAENGKPFFAKTAMLRETKRKELRKQSA